MRKLLKKYLKPFIFGFILAIGLLFIQAFSDLNLPNYMSNLVNVGIQQSGVEDEIPEVIKKEDYLGIKMLMNSNEQKLLDSNYSLGEKADVNDIDVLDVGKTKGPANDEIYVFTGYASEKNIASIENAFGKSSWAMMYMKNDGSTPKVAMEKADKIDASLIQQSGPMITKTFYNNLGVDLEKLQSNYIWKIGLLMLGISLLGGTASILVSLISARIAAGVARNLRRDIFAKVESFSNEEFDKFQTSSLITRSTNDINQIQMLLTLGIRMLCYAPIMAIGGVVMALEKSVSMGWVIVVAVAALLGLMITIFSIAIPRFKSMQKLVDKVNLVAREGLNGLMVIRAFGNEKFEKKRFDVANKNLTSVNLFINRTMAIMMPSMMFILNSTCVLVIWVGAHQISDATMQVGDMMAFMQYVMQVIFSFLMISMMFIFIPRASVSAERIMEVLNTNPSIKDPDEPTHIEKKNIGKVEFKNVFFKYHGADEYALSDISFLANPGETTAFIGATGSGKTTIGNLIPRFYDATEGSIFVDGVNVKDITQHELRGHIGYVPQKNILMSGTIESNISYGKKISPEEMKEVAKVAQSLNFIEEKEDGFSSEISQGGTNVSGGQRQRLAIARALAINPDIYIFDDSFSALDFKTDTRLRKALKEKTQNATVIIIAQRVTTIMEANQIYVIDDGKIVGHGTHKELLKTCPEYLEIASSQLSEKEVSDSGK